MIYRASEGEKLTDIVREASKLRTPDNIPAVVVVMPWLMGDGHPQMIGLDDLERLA